MPISPTPPSGAKTSSWLAWAISARPDGEHVARGHRNKPAALLQKKPAGVIEPSEAAEEFAVGQAHADLFAQARRARKPVGADLGEALTLPPLQKTLLHRDGQCFNDQLRSNIRADAAQVRRRIRRVVRMRRAIHADADGDGKSRAAFALNQNAGELGTDEQQIVRPFQLKLCGKLRHALR